MEPTRAQRNEKNLGINFAYMDTTVNPENDFLRFVNGKWLDSKEVPSGKTTWGSFNELREKTDADALLEGASSNQDLDSAPSYQEDEWKESLIWTLFNDAFGMLATQIERIT